MHCYVLGKTSLLLGRFFKTVSKSIGNCSEGNYFDEAEPGPFSVLKDIM